MQDVFELQRNLNNAFAYDLVPSPSVITAALRAARRVNDFPTAVRIFEGKTRPTASCTDTKLHTDMCHERYGSSVGKDFADGHCFCTPGIKAKVENKGQYDEYIDELRPIQEELGVVLKEELFPDSMAGERLGSARGA